MPEETPEEFLRRTAAIGLLFAALFGGGAKDADRKSGRSGCDSPEPHGNQPAEAARPKPDEQ